MFLFPKSGREGSVSDDSLRIELTGSALQPVVESLARTALALDRVLEDIASMQESINELTKAIERDYYDSQDES